MSEPFEHIINYLQEKLKPITSFPTVSENFHLININIYITQTNLHKLLDNKCIFSKLKFIPKFSIFLFPYRKPPLAYIEDILNKKKNRKKFGENSTSFHITLSGPAKFRLTYRRVYNV